jgi:hypothetical protein
MKWLLNLFRSIARFFTTRNGYESFLKILPYVKIALPYIELAAGIVSGAVQPTEAITSILQQKFPHLSADGLPKTEDEKKVFAIAVATELMRADFGDLSTHEIRKALELAYGDYKALKEPTQ